MLRPAAESSSGDGESSGGRETWAVLHPAAPPPCPLALLPVQHPAPVAAPWDAGLHGIVKDQGRLCLHRALCSAGRQPSPAPWRCQQHRNGKPTAHNQAPVALESLSQLRRTVPTASLLAAGSAAKQPPGPHAPATGTGNASWRTPAALLPGARGCAALCPGLAPRCATRCPSHTCSARLTRPPAGPKPRCQQRCCPTQAPHLQ